MSVDADDCDYHFLREGVRVKCLPVYLLTKCCQLTDVGKK